MRPVCKKLVLEKKLDLPTPLLQLYGSNGLPVSELPQDGNTGEINEAGASNSTFKLVQDAEMGNSLELENKKNDHKMEDNLEENHHEVSSEKRQLLSMT